MENHESALKHGIATEDIEHAVTNAMAIEDRDDDTRLHLGADRSGNLLEVVTIVRNDRSQQRSAMRMRPQ